MNERLERIPKMDVLAQTGVGEQALRSGIWTIEKYIALADGLPDLQRGLIEKPIIALNAYVNAGGQALLDLLIGASGVDAFNNANANIGVGDSSTAVAASQTNLQAASNKLRKGMDASYPQRSGQVMTWRSTFGSSEANWAWAEAALFNAASAGTMLSRIVAALGTKASGTSWISTYTITVP